MEQQDKQQDVKHRLHQYIYLRFEYESHQERLALLKAEEEYPSKPGDNIGGGSGTPNRDRMEKAIIRRMMYEEKTKKRIAEIAAEIDEIDEAIDSLQNPLEREVLRLRYTDGENNRHMEWKDISMKIYGDNDEKHLLATYRLHGRALVSITKVFEK